MLKFKNIMPADVQKISALKEEGETEPASVNAAGGAPQPNLVMPHDTFLVGLSSLKAPGDPLPEASGMRVIDASENHFNRIFDLLPVGGSEKEPQLYKDRDYVKSYERGFDHLFRSGMGESDYEVRSLKIPALHVEALWLHQEANPDADVYVPVRAMGLLNLYQSYDKDSFFSILKNAAEQYDFTDDLLGGS